MSWKKKFILLWKCIIFCNKVDKVFLVQKKTKQQQQQQKQKQKQQQNQNKTKQQINLLKNW